MIFDLYAVVGNFAVNFTHNLIASFFQYILFLLRILILDLLHFLSWGKSDSLKDEPDYDGYDSGSSGTCSFPAFPLRFDDSVCCVIVLGSRIFVPTGVESKCDIFVFVVFVPI